jgi:uncharacterized membrane protein
MTFDVPWNWEHWHLLLNHFPIIGTIIALCLFLFGIIAKNEEWKRASLGIFGFTAIMAILAFVSGNGAGLSLQVRPGVTLEMVNRHEGAAELATILMLFTGALSVIALWQYRGSSRPASWILPAVLVLSILTCGQMARTGNLGGVLSHPEVLADGDATATETTMIGKIAHVFEPDPAKFSLAMVSSKMGWALLMDLHFIGLAMLMGTVVAVDMRVLGFAKQLRMSSLNKLMPWGAAGLAINVVTGMLAFVGMPQLYGFNLAFNLKMAAILLAGVNLALFYGTSAYRDCEAVEPGGDAPIFAKALAGSALFLWFAVLILGRYIQPFADTLRH